MGYVLVHGGSGDHTGEDRVRGICGLLPEQPEIFSPAPEEDWRYGLGELGGLSRISPGAMAGWLRAGDWVVTSHPGLAGKLPRGVKRILWGWEPRGPLSGRQADQLKRFHRVVVMDRRSAAFLRRAGVGRSLRIGPDPSFLVGRAPRSAEEMAREETVGLCFSTAIGFAEAAPGVLFRSYCHLIRWILDNTTWKIALIPYCVGRKQSDEPLHRALMAQFPREERLICRGDGSCLELRHDLSLCRVCVGTAGVPAAWSCMVPGLCIGVSGRVRGLNSTLLGGNTDGIVPVAALRREGDLTEAFRRFLQGEDAMRRRLEVAVPRYRQWAREWSW